MLAPLSDGNFSVISSPLPSDCSKMNEYLVHHNSFVEYSFIFEHSNMHNSLVKFFKKLMHRNFFGAFFMVFFQAFFLCGGEGWIDLLKWYYCTILNNIISFLGHSNM